MAHFEAVLSRLRERNTDMHGRGRAFERLMRNALARNPDILGQRFRQVWLWSEWPERDGPDMGIDLVAEEEDGGVCAIQCKFLAPDRPVRKKEIQSFLVASEGAPFTSRLLINTGGSIHGNTLRTLHNSPKPCRVLEWEEMDGWAVDWLACEKDPDALRYRERARYHPHSYQAEALDAVVKGFEHHARGQLILPCGTGKTVATLWIAERQVGLGGRVLYLVPSIALMSQTMREWSRQQKLDLGFVGICSDTRAGRTDEDASLLELDIPVTTDLDRITNRLKQQDEERMTVVFCTYQSLPLVVEAQAQGVPVFDLVICDEAHRTTGIEDRSQQKSEDGISPFRLVHDETRLRAHKRLYTTATPRIYTDAARGKAADRNLDIYSMDDEAVYGPQLYRMEFSEAIEGGWLTDYQVIILALKSNEVQVALESLLAREKATDINLDDAVKLLGCWDALADPVGLLAEKNITGDRAGSLRRAIAYTNTIRSSERVAKYWTEVVKVASQSQTDLLLLEVEHVDGTQHSLDRQSKLNWLQSAESDQTDECRVLSNARCLTEGVDVPALDAVLFLQPRRSQVDVVQAVGRVMRRAPGKRMGYIILPVVVPPDRDPVQALDDSKVFGVVWSVLRALRSHDDRFDLEINALDLNSGPSQRIKIISDNVGDDTERVRQLALDLVCEIPSGAIHAQIVEKCGDRKYWPQWAADVAEIADRIRTRVIGLIADPERIILHRRFQSFLADLRRTLHRELSEEDLVAMIAQHMVTGPVFQALFAHYDFVGRNPVARALSRLVELLEREGLQNETRDLEPFYASVRRRAAALDSAEARQKVLLELYERFFQVALKREAERLGIVYTPVEVVDFILHSADHALHKHMGRRLTESGVHVLDPFTGTGTFLVRLLQNLDLIQDGDLARKFASELHANEIVLLAYYIAAINVEEAYHGRRGMATDYAPFDGITFADTFNLAEGTGQFAEALPVNSERVRAQQRRDITVIVGNPPWSVGQRNAIDNNPNVSYPRLKQRVRETYAAASHATLKRSLYDSYKLAIRWASDRIGEAGVVAFVTNGSFVDGNADGGLRACLAREFSDVYVYHLRGNQRTQGERSRREGGKIFGSGSRAPVSILVLVRDPAHQGTCRIRYKDIGDYLSREEKLEQIRSHGSIRGILDWQFIQPDAYHDWLDQRDPSYQAYMPLGSKEAKSKKISKPGVAIRFYSRGICANGDAWLYSFGRMQLIQRAQDMDIYYRNRRDAIAEGRQHWEEATRNDDLVRFKWHSDLRDRCRRGSMNPFRPDDLRVSLYRPFVKQYLNFNTVYIQRIYQVPTMFPTPRAKNEAIGVTGKGATTPFSTLMTDLIPDLATVSIAQWFPRWRYEPHDPGSADAWIHRDGVEDAEIVPGYRRVDNLTDWCLQRFRNHYPTLTINKDDIWYYLYGVLHAPDYRTRYASDLAKDLPRIPFAPDFGAFRDAGVGLATLHLGYASCPEYDLATECSGEEANPFRLDTKPMQWGGTRKEPDRSMLQVTSSVTLRGIPEAAHRYTVNGRTPLEWTMDRLRIIQHKESGIVNDPNAWFVEDPSAIVNHLRRLVHLSVETVRIVESLPPALEG